MPRPKKKKKIKPIFIRINEDLAADFKAHCAKRGISMNKFLYRFIRKTIKSQ